MSSLPPLARRCGHTACFAEGAGHFGDLYVASAGVEFDRANAARMYDFMLGGGHNFAVDREQVARVLAAHPDIEATARANRAFLGRVVRRCVGAGIDQFLDLGSGVPTVGNVHEIALGLDPNARVAYVDFEPVAVEHALDVVADLDTVTVTRADLRDTRTLLAAPGVAGLLNFARPVALLMVAVLHFVPGDLRALLTSYREALAPGSAVAISHSVNDHPSPELAERMRGMAAAYEGTATEATLRSRAEVAALLDGLDLEPPGLVDVVDWPEPRARPTQDTAVYGALAHVPL